MSKEIKMTVFNNHNGYVVKCGDNEFAMTFVPYNEETEYVADFIFQDGEDIKDINDVRCGAPITFEDILYYF
jgi:hypothetical protein